MKKPSGAELQNILERTFNFAVRIVQLSGKLDERPGVGRIMMSQILRAGTSVPSNVEEAQAGQSKRILLVK
jgi:four helix bundle protein